MCHDTGILQGTSEKGNGGSLKTLGAILEQVSWRGSHFHFPRVIRPQMHVSKSAQPHLLQEPPVMLTPALRQSAIGQGELESWNPLNKHS